MGGDHNMLLNPRDLKFCGDGISELWWNREFFSKMVELRILWRWNLRTVVDLGIFVLVKSGGRIRKKNGWEGVSEQFILKYFMKNATLTNLQNINITN